MFTFRRSVWGRLRFYRFEFRLMGIMTMGAKEVSPLPWIGKKPGPFSMDACSPILVNIAMAFAAEPVAFREVDEFPIVKS
jgi:hypothetical protein